MPDAAYRELVELVRSRATGEGRIASALPGLWLFRFDAPQPVCRHSSTSMYLGIAVQGRKLIRSGGLELAYEPLSYLLLRGEVAYTAETVTASPAHPYLAIGLSLSPRLVAQAMLEIAAAGHSYGPATGPLPAAYTAPLDLPLVDGMCRLLRTLDHPTELRILGPLIIRELVYRLLLSDASAQFRQAAQQQGERERIAQAMAYIDANAAARLSVEAIARHVAMSPSHFAHRFRAIASVSPMRYQKHVRMERARELLLTGARASEVAGQLGYASDAHFTRDFKRQFGLAPGSYARTFEREVTAFAAEGGSPTVAASASAGLSKRSAEPALGGLHAPG